MLPKSIRDWITGAPPEGSLFGSRVQVMLWVLRTVFIALMIGIATSALYFFDNHRMPGVGIAVFMLLLLTGLIIVTVDALAKNKQISTISSVYFGLGMGFLLGYWFWVALEPIVNSLFPEVVPNQADVYQPVKHLIRLFITIFTCYISVSVLMQTKDEFRFIIPYIEFSKQIKGARPLVLDTSVIIDGRIADICETGIVDTKLIVPRFVLQELQGIADSSDKVKRNRGRRGLDVLKRMQAHATTDLQMHEGNLEELRDVQKVDERLVIFAKVMGARVVTNDYNLNKISQLQGVEVINLNELANALKLVALPGENLTIRVVKQGDQVGQGVGYLDDGTMVVVEQGRSVIGQEVHITVTSVLQTPAGRMIFGKIEGKPLAGTEMRE